VQGAAAVHRLIAIPLKDGTLNWQYSIRDQEETGFALVLKFGKGHSSERVAFKWARQLVEEINPIAFVKPTRSVWQLDVGAMRQWLAGQDEFKTFTAGLDWLEGVVNVVPKMIIRQTPTPGDFAYLEETTFIEIAVFQEDYDLTRSTKLFLSHKGADKAMVCHYAAILKTLGFDPWIDEEDLSWGENPDRAILEGFKNSCAAIFFITPEFKDEKWLATEIELALNEKRDKGKRFAIVAIRFKNRQGEMGVVPELLKRFLYGEPKSHLKALGGILKAIPLHVGPVTWKAGRT
jgi:hypothetical protein